MESRSFRKNDLVYRIEEDRKQRKISRGWMVFNNAYMYFDMSNKGCKVLVDCKYTVRCRAYEIEVGSSTSIDWLR